MRAASATARACPAWPLLDSLTAMGHTIHEWRYKTGVNAIAKTPDGWVGVADPRRGGGAVGY